MIVGPVYALVPLRVSVAVPVFVRLLGPWASEIAPEKTELLTLLTVRAVVDDKDGLPSAMLPAPLRPLTVALRP